MDVTVACHDGTVEIAVTDRGIGIPPEHRERVFDRFHQANEAGRGMGLGLYISRQIVELHGGRLLAEHPREGGTRMVLRLPRGIVKALVVDDDDAIRQFLRMALTDNGYEVVTAGDGWAALDLARESPPDVIFLDMRMPGMDGWTFARLYRGGDGATRADRGAHRGPGRGGVRSARSRPTRSCRSRSSSRICSGWRSARAPARTPPAGGRAS